MGKNKSASGLINVINYDNFGNISFVSGSTTLMQISSSGAITTTGVISGSSVQSASLAQNSNLLQGTGSVGFTTTGSFTTMSSSLSSRTTQIESVYATTGSNSFRATQSITGSLTVTGQIIAQTLNVQQVTSSIVYSSGSNTFGCDINSRQTFTGSFYQCGSLSSFSSCVGIYTQTPKSYLHLSGENSFNTPLADILLTRYYTNDSLVAGSSLFHFYNNADSKEYLAIGVAGSGGTAGKPNQLSQIKMVVGANGNVGINTSIPNNMLTVASGSIGLISNSYGSTGLLRIYGTDGCEKYQQGLTTGGDFYQYTFSGQNHIFYTNGANERMRIFSGGNISIGRCDDSYKLNIATDTPKTCTTSRGLLNLTTCESFSCNPFGLVITATGGASLATRKVTIGTTDFGLANGGLLELNGALFVCNNGNVGIGTSSPTLQLHVNSNTGDYNTMFSTSCVCGRSGFVIARPGTTSAIASALVLASDSSYRLGGGSYYNIKMMQDGSTSILNTSEGDALKVAAGGAVSINTGTSAVDAANQRLQVYGAIRQDVLGVSYGEGMIMNFPANGTNYGGLFFHSTATAMATVGAGSIKWGINYNYTPEGGTGAGNLGFVNANTTTMMDITSGGCIYIGKGWGATNHRINLQKPQGCTILVISGYSGASNDSVVISAASGAGYNGALTVMGVTTNSSSGRSISAGGTINASGGDYAEYMTKRSDAGCIAKGQIVGIDACKLLTDKWSLAESFVVKSTDPSYVGGDVWDKNIGKRPEQTTDITDEEFAPILAEYEIKLEEARNKVDRIAFSGQVPVIVSGSYNVGDYILPIEGPNDTIVGVACSLSSLTLQDYGKTVGKVWGTCLDKAWIAVKIG